MSLVSAVGGIACAVDGISEKQREAGLIAKEIARYGEQSNNIGAEISRVQSYFANMMNFAMMQLRQSGNSPDGNDIIRYIQNQERIQVSILERKQKRLHDKEKELNRMKNWLETYLQIEEANLKREKKFVKKAIKIGFEYA